VLVDRGGRELPIAARYTGGEFQVPAGKVLMLERAQTGGALALRLADQRRSREGATPA